MATATFNDLPTVQGFDIEFTDSYYVRSHVKATCQRCGYSKTERAERGRVKALALWASDHAAIERGDIKL